MMKDTYNVSYTNDGFEGGLDTQEKPNQTSNVTLKKVVSIGGEAKDTNGTKETANIPEQQEPVRAQWDNQCEFILSAVGYAVGLGNVWRFPYLAYENGGGTFLLPYAIMLFTAGLPLFFMELALGQYSGQGPTRVFGRLAPALKGLGFGMLAITFYVAIYYNVIIAWTLFYMFSGMQSELPWIQCTNASSSPHCHEGNITLEDQQNDHYTVGPAEDYFNWQMLGLEKDPQLGDRENNWQNLGGLRWQLVLCLLGAWVIVCLCLIKGVQSAGKVVYFTALFPFVVLIILFIYGMTLEGALDGVEFYVTPNFEKLGDISVWTAAANQIFYSLGPTFGGLITLSSYNRFDNNCHRGALLVAFLNCGTSVFAGFVVFSIIGNLAHETSQPVTEVIKNGPGLAFIAYPEAVSKMGGGGSPVPQIMSFLFFTMLLTLGLDSMFTFVETLTTCIMDHFKQLAKYKAYVVITTCVVSFLFGLPMCTEGGIFMFDLVDKTCASWNILIFAIIEVILVAWGYGADNFLENIKEMGMDLPRFMVLYWRTCWCYITPCLLSFLVIVQFAQQKPLQTLEYVFNGTEVPYIWPNGCSPGHFDNTTVITINSTITTEEFHKSMHSTPDIQSLGLLISFSSLLLVPLIGLYQLFKRTRKGKPLGMAMFQKTHNWKPANASAESLKNIVDEAPKTDIFKRQTSRRGSRKSFRKHLPPNAETLE